MIVKIFKQLHNHISEASGVRKRSSIELRSFVDRLNARVADVELDIEF
jgi:hypothetical protein